MFRRLTDSVHASPQISLADIEAAAADGFTLIVNNRPDGEEPTAPQSADIEKAAKAAGLDYVAIPVTHSGFSGPQVAAMAKALDEAGGKVLAYCRSGTRSTLLWALARASQGDNPDTLAQQAAQAGYDLAPVRAMLDALSSDA